MAFHRPKGSLDDIALLVRIFRQRPEAVSRICIWQGNPFSANFPGFYLHSYKSSRSAPGTGSPHCCRRISQSMDDAEFSSVALRTRLQWTEAFLGMRDNYRSLANVSFLVIFEAGTKNW